MKKLAILFVVLAAALPAVEFMDIDEIKPGMQGIGKTVFQGTKIEDFSVEIIGVMKKVSPHSDVILAKLSGASLEKTGVMSGMSGSPIYIDGKLVGAIAYSFGPFSKEPIAGITPIHEMLDVLNRTDADKPQDFSFTKTTAGTGSFQPLAIPVAASGVTEDFLSLFPKMFSTAGLVPVTGTGQAQDTNFTLEPGAAVGVQLVQGDLDITAMGTLTYKNGDKILAFGHNLFSGGSVDLPLCGGFVNTVLPSQNQSYKMISPLETIGRIFQDRRAGIAGIIGEAARLIPFSVDVTSAGTTEHYRYQVIDNKLLTPNLIGLCSYSSIQSTERTTGGATIDYDLKLHIKNRPVLERKNLFSGYDAPGEALDAVAGDLSLLLNNRLGDVELTSGQLTLNISEQPQTAAIARAYITEDIVKPGAELELIVFLKPYAGTEQTKTIKLALPKDLTPGALTVFVSQADSATIYERKAVPGKYTPENVDQLIDLMSRRPGNNEIVVSVFSAAEGATAGGKELPVLPPSVVSVLKQSKADGVFELTGQTLILRQTIPTNYVIKGGATLAVTVER